MLLAMKNDTAAEFVNKFLTIYCSTYIGRPGFVVAWSRCLELQHYSKHQWKDKERALGDIKKKSHKQPTEDACTLFVLQISTVTGIV